jgi:hypothetical protein
VTGIDDRYDRVERGMAPQRLIEDKRLDHWRRIREPGRLDHNMIDRAPALQNARHRARKVAANRTADATVVELENLFVGGDDELPVDTSFAELVDDHRDLAALIGGQYLVEQSRLAGTKKSSENSRRYHLHADIPFVVAHPALVRAMEHTLTGSTGKSLSLSVVSAR